MDYPHQPVLLQEVVTYLMPDPDGVYVDGTVGTGGHSVEIGKRLGEGGRLICLDKDPDAVARSEERLRFLGKRVQCLKASYGDLEEILKNLGLREVDGVLLDLGMSSLQLEGSGRGFSFKRDEPLDMRMDPEGEVTAAEMINALPQAELERILREYGEERKARSIAKAIVRERGNRRLETSAQLSDLISSILPKLRRKEGKHPATRTFQALRIAVNRELENLDAILQGIPSLLKKGGRLVVLSYHSLEDRRVKQSMKSWEDRCTCPRDIPYCTCGRLPLFRRLTRRGIRPSAEEIEDNPRARSAVLRAAERI